MSTKQRPLASNSRRAVFACPEGGEAVLHFPTPLTEDTLEMLAELCALMFRGLKRDAVQWDDRQKAEAEYQSWGFAAPAERGDAK